MSDSAITMMALYGMLRRRRPAPVRVACKLCGREDEAPGPFRLGSLTECTGGHWCRDAKTCKRAEVSRG